MFNVPQVPFYSLQRKEDECTVRVWHAMRENTRGAQTFRRIIWDRNAPFPSCDCGLHISSGIPCVHVLLVLGNQGVDLFDRSMFHVHWTRRTKVRVAEAIEDHSQILSIPSCSPHIASSAFDEHAQNNNTATPVINFAQEECTGSGDSYNMQPPTPNSDIRSPTLNLAKPYDRVNTGKLMAITRVLIDLVTRPAAKHKGLDQKLYDVLKTFRSQLTHSAGEDGQSTGVDFEQPDNTTSRTLFQPDNGDIATIANTNHCGGAPQQIRKKKRFEPEPLRDSFPAVQFEVGTALSQVSAIASSKSPHPKLKDTLCRFCGAAGCTRRRYPKIQRFGSRLITGQVFYDTTQQLLSSPVLFENLGTIEGIIHGGIVNVQPSWKKGNEFRHIVLKSWLRSAAPEHSGKLFVWIVRVKKKLVCMDSQELGVIVNAEELYNEYCMHKLAKKSISTLIVVQGLYVSVN